MTSGNGLKISFCTTCRGADYLERLKKTLPENLRRNTGKNHHGNVEFVVVAYGDANVTEWLKENYSGEIKSGLIRAVDVPREQAEFFKMAHAKNIAHRMATGDVLCNLDCDNITGENFSGWLNDQFSANPNIVACVTTRDKLLKKLTTGVNPSDITGRVAISRRNFEMLHGYNEEHNAAKDGDDVNLKERAYASGLKSVSLPSSQHGEVLPHSDESRLAHMSPDDSAKSRGNFQSRGNFWERTRTIRRVVLGESRVIPGDISGANPDGNFGCADVTLLDRGLEPQQHHLGPMSHPDWSPLYQANHASALAKKSSAAGTRPYP